MKSMKKTFLTTVVAGTLITAMTMSAAAFTETRGTVNGTGVSIRAEASAQSERVSSVTSGNRLDVIDETSDANGTKWYKVRVDASRVGFIRSDLITLENTSSTGTTTISTSTTTTTTDSSTATTVTDTSSATTSTTSGSSSATATTEGDSSIATTTTTVSSAATTSTGSTATTSSGGTQTGTVISERINVRREASASSDAIGALARDARIYVTGSVTGSDGNRWYQVRYTTGGVEKNGYVRSDLLRVSDSASNTAASAAAATTSASSSTSSVTTTSGSTTVSTVKELTPQAGTITGSTVNVRQSSGTSSDSMGALTRNTQVTITGETTGSDNAKWYRVRFTSGGSEKTGFVRADLMRIGAPAAEPANNAATTSVTSTAPAQAAPAQTPTAQTEPASEEQPAPEAVPETPEGAEGAEGTEGAETTEEPASENSANMGDEYSLVRTAGSDGVEAWYLYDNVNKNRAKVEDLMNAARSIGTLTDLEQSNKTLKTALIILGILLVLLLAAVIFLFIKMRNLLYYEDEGEDEVVVPRRREKVTPQPERERAPKRRRPAEDEDDGMDRIRKREEKRRPAQAREEAPRAERPHRKSPEAGAAPASAVTDKAAAETVAEEAAKRPRKPKNFVRDEDFEFEFLDLDEDGRK